ncbi:hypothetical protein [Thalassovita litoralis]|jgi:hypothetical protein|uniref:hypothetical protein n=1 Tax=Thalassovita litoralis TaxID=1010611 RepID=UPI0011572961|nr:hypothetical protein [Thalassovita litoralis]
MAPEVYADRARGFRFQAGSGHLLIVGILRKHAPFDMANYPAAVVQDVTDQAGNRAFFIFGDSLGSERSDVTECVKISHINQMEPLNARKPAQ